MGAARLLTKRENDSQRHGAGQRDPRRAPRAIAQRKVPGHQCEGGSGMPARETLCVRQIDRPVTEHTRVRPMTTESFQIPGTIDVGHCLERTDQRDNGEHAGHREHELLTPGCEPRDTERGEAGCDGQRDGGARDPAAVAMDQSSCPPGAVPGAEPAACRIEKQLAGDPRIPMRDEQQSEHGRERQQRPADMAAPVAQGQHKSAPVRANHGVVRRAAAAVEQITVLPIRRGRDVQQPEHGVEQIVV